jgi:hypothetical protein
MTDDRLATAWQAYNRVFEEAAQLIASVPRFANDPDYQRRLYRNLMQVQAMAYNFAIVPRTDRPRVFVHTTYLPDFYTLGMACPDFHYVGLFLDGRRRYRISGRRGAVAWMSAQVQSHLIGDPRSKVVGDFDFADLDVGPDGSFEAIISGRPESGNHIPIDPNSAYNFIWLRRILGDWADDVGDFHIELIGEPATPEPESTDAFAERIEQATHLAGYLLKNWSVGLYDWYASLSGGLNRIAFLEGARLSDRDVGSLAAYYAGFLFKIAPDEALIIEGDVPQGVYWAFQLGDIWSTSLDYIYHQADINMKRMAVDADGKYRAVLTLQDPGLANWLDPAGNLEGIGMMRVFRSPERPVLPELKLVKLADLDRHLPAGTKRVAAAERKAALAHRETSIRAMYGQ